MRKIKRFPWNVIRHLSKLGITSRKQACELVLGGRVQINGRVVRDPGTNLRPGDRITVDGRPVRKEERVYVLLNKPPGYVTTRQDERGRKTVYDLLPGITRWLFPIGRLDRESEGLLLLTNDTALGESLTNPERGVPRTYEVTVKPSPSAEEIRKIREGISLGSGQTSRPAKVRILRQMAYSSVLEITLTEGKNREIRRMFEGLGKQVLRLKRIRFGPFHLGNLPCGRYRTVTGLS